MGFVGKVSFSTCIYIIYIQLPTWPLSWTNNNALLSSVKSGQSLLGKLGSIFLKMLWNFALLAKYFCCKGWQRGVFNRNGSFQHDCMNAENHFIIVWQNNSLLVVWETEASIFWWLMKHKSLILTHKSCAKSSLKLPYWISIQLQNIYLFRVS